MQVLTENNEKNIQGYSMGNLKQLILETAQKLFIKKDYNKVSLKKIAQFAEVDTALITSIFNNKEFLYDRVFENVMSELSLKVNERFNIHTTLEENIRGIISGYFDLFIENPALPLFIFSYLHKYPGKITTPLSLCNSFYSSEILLKQLWGEFGKGKISLQNSDHFCLNLFSLIIYPFAIHRIIYRNRNFNDKTFKSFMLQRKEIILDMVMLSINK